MFFKSINFKVFSQKALFVFFIQRVLIFVYTIYLVEKFISKRKTNASIVTFLSDPNLFFSCAVDAFFRIGFFFVIILVSFNLFIFIYSSVNMYEYYIIFICTLFFSYLRIWVSLVVDYDLSPTFSFYSSNQNQISNWLINWSNVWDFSAYFSHYFGIYFDLYIAYYIYFYIVGIFYRSSILYNNVFFYSWGIRIYSFFIDLYYFSGETFFYDIVRFIFFRLLIEACIFFREFIWTLKNWFPIN